MTQAECKNDPILAILNGYCRFHKIGEWKEETTRGRDSGVTLELVEIVKSPARFAQISWSFLDEETEIKPLLAGEEVWLKYPHAELVEWIK